MCRLSIASIDITHDTLKFEKLLFAFKIGIYHCFIIELNNFLFLAPQHNIQLLEHLGNTTAVVIILYTEIRVALIVWPYK